LRVAVNLDSCLNPNRSFGYILWHVSLVTWDFPYLDPEHVYIEYLLGCGEGREEGEGVWSFCGEKRKKTEPWKGYEEDFVI